MHSPCSWRVLFVLTGAALALACGEERARGPIPYDAGGDPCAPAARPCDAGANEGDAGPRVGDGGTDASDAGDAGAGELGPCSERQGSTLAYDLCLWARPEDLDELAARPDARLEVAADVSLAGKRYQGAELELHGGTARTFDKKSYRVRFPEQRPEYDFFGDGAQEQERLVLQAAVIDPTFVRAKLVMDLVRELGGLAPRIGFARVHINGEFVGLYQVIERIDEHYLDRQGFARTGNLYKAEGHAANWGNLESPLAGFAERTNVDDKADDLAALFRVAMNTEASHQAFERDLAPLLSMEDFYVWHLVMAYTLNLDTFTKNYYLYHDTQASDAQHGKAFRVIHWDADTSLGMWWDGRRYWENDIADVKGGLNHNKLSARLFAIPEYRKPYLERFRDLLESTFASAAVWSRARSLLDALEPDIAHDREKWARTGSIADERDYLEQTIALRHDVMSKAVSEALAE
jgi:spore coat protein H